MSNSANNLTLIRGVDKQPRRLLQVVSNSGGLGDCLARMVAVREVLRLDPNVDIRLFTFDFMLPLIENMSELKEYLKNGRLWICDVKDIAQWVNKQQPGVVFAERSFTPSRLSLVDDGLLTLADTINEINGKQVQKHYCTIDTSREPFPIGVEHATEKKLVVVTTGFTAPVRQWPVNEINNYISWLKLAGFMPVLLGNSEAKYVDISLPEVNAEGCIDLRNKTSLMEAARIMSGAVLVVGVDNGLLHLAASVGAPIIAGYTTINPEYRMLANTEAVITPYKSLDCRFCQSKYNFAFEHDFRVCIYGDRECTKHMSAARFIEASARFLGVRI